MRGIALAIMVAGMSIRKGFAQRSLSKEEFELFYEKIKNPQAFFVLVTLFVIAMGW